jgi:hypothetical protein
MAPMYEDPTRAETRAWAAAYPEPEVIQYVAAEALSDESIRVRVGSGSWRTLTRAAWYALVMAYPRATYVSVDAP